MFICCIITIHILSYTVITWRQILQDACTRKNLAAGYPAIDSEFTEDRIAPRNLLRNTGVK